MLSYLIRRLILLPITLFCIILVNFIIINLAPGDPVTVTEISQEGGATRQENRSLAFGTSDIYLQFREFYGLTLPILFNTWPWTSAASVYADIWSLTYRRSSPSSNEQLSFKEYEKIRVKMGDKARFIMPKLLAIASDEKEDIGLQYSQNKMCKQCTNNK